MSRTRHNLLFIGILHLCISFATAGLVSSATELQECVAGSDEECIIPQDTTILLPSQLFVNRVVTIRGLGDSRIDLGHQDRLATVLTGSGDRSLTLMDLEVLNGNQTTAALLRAQTTTSFSLIRVTVRNMILQTGAVLYIDLKATGILSEVLFINCSGTTTAFIEAFHPSNLTVEDITISGAPPYAHMFYIQTTYEDISAPNITFGGNISTETGIFVATHAAFSAALAIRSNPYNPARYYITPRIGSPMFIFFIGSHLTFEAQSVYVATPGRRFSGEVFSLSANFNPNGTADITIHENFIVDGLSSIDSKKELSYAALRVGGLFSVLNGLGSAITISCPTLITAASAVLGNVSSASITLTSNLTMKVSNDLLIWNPPALGSFTTNPGSNAIIIEAGNSVNVSNSRLMITSSSLSISAKQIIFERSVSMVNSGGAIYAANSSVSLIATESILFKGNQATDGGAIYADASTVLTLSGSTRFESNIASANGGAAYIYAQNVGALNTSSFWSNQALNGEGCTVYLSDSCTPFTTSGSHGFNLQIMNDSASLCGYNENLCSTSLPPSTPPQLPCTGTQPSVGTWTCQNGQWTSVGDVSADQLTIPSTTTVVVIGNLTLSGDLTFTGLQSSVTVQHGCTSIGGTVTIEISAEELEALSKEDGSSRTLTLITQSSTCSSLAGVAVNAYKTGSNCRYIEPTTTAYVSNGSRSTLTALFKVNSYRCNTKWIILGCVLGGILLVVLIIVLIVTFNDKAKSAVRPFWARGQNKSE